MGKDQKKTVVLGASENPQRYSNLAVKRLRALEHPVIAIGRKQGKIDDVPLLTEHPAEHEVDTVTVFLNERNQKLYYDYIFSLHPEQKMMSWRKWPLHMELNRSRPAL